MYIWWLAGFVRAQSQLASPVRRPVKRLDDRRDDRPDQVDRQQQQGRPDEDPGQQPASPARREAHDDGVESGVEEPDAAHAHGQRDGRQDQLGGGAVAAPGPQGVASCGVAEQVVEEGRHVGRGLVIDQEPDAHDEAGQPEDRRRSASGSRASLCARRVRTIRSRHALPPRSPAPSLAAGQGMARRSCGAPSQPQCCEGYSVGQLSSMAWSTSSVFSPLAPIHSTDAGPERAGADRGRHQVAAVEAEERGVGHQVGGDLQLVVAGIPLDRGGRGWRRWRCRP